MDNEETTTYTGADFAKDLVVETAKSVAITAAGYVVGFGLLAGAGFIAQKVQARRASKENQDTVAHAID